MTYTQSLRWMRGLPRPAGAPEEILSVETASSRTDPEVAAAWLAQPRVWLARDRGPAWGVRPYSVTVQSHSDTPERPPVRWSDATKHRVRRLRLWRRLTKALPLVAPEEFVRRVSAAPETYGEGPPLPPDDAPRRKRPAAYEPSRVRKARMKAERRAAEETAARAAGWARRPVSVPEPAWEPGSLFADARPS